MDLTDSKDYTPILPYDITLGESFVIYDNTTYQRDHDLCNKETIHMESGNIVKYSTCNITKATKIGGD
ncbi:hypothetical protein [Clostridium sp. Marseille-P299]|uniref:hypothetical protein n=1 Tax=Clostridium sp. Marseille-P299 TaxID=1805477 RepID=UPI00082B05AF|nr:hypothetical protein [Clostridium sp. Marseille-P299]